MSGTAAVADPARLLKGTPVAEEIKARVTSQIKHITEVAKERAPCLVAVVAGSDAGSLAYCESKMRNAAKCGLSARAVHVSDQAELHKTLRDLSADPSVDGVMLEFPLPAGYDEQAAIDCIAPAKDVDGLTPLNAGMLTSPQRESSALVPCTAMAIVTLLERAAGLPGNSLRGVDVAVVSRSKVVGRPLIQLLLNRSATVTVCHTGTKDLPAVTRRAQVVVTAAGKAGLITDDMVGEGAIVVDAGYATTPDGKVVGDVASVPKIAAKASKVTPPTGGVGPVTTALMLSNVVKAFLSSHPSVTLPK